MPRPALPVRLAAWALAFAAVAAPARAADPPAQSTWTGVDKVVAFADVHGSNADLVGLLMAAKVIDDKRHWSAGRTHVVSLGDLLDRGLESRQVMDLLMRLQGEATAAGGALHVVLGNHEAMNLLGDLRYVTADEFAAFAQEEPRGERERRKADWISRNGPDSGVAFDQRFPPGYFGHRAAFAPNGRYGRWLLSLPVVIAVNDSLFMHAGPSKVVRNMTLAEINTRYRSALVEYLAALADVEDAGLVRDSDVFNQRADLATRRLNDLAPQDGAQQMKLAAAVQRFRVAAESPLLGVEGPNWYRGPALCNECSEADTLGPILDRLGLRRLVAGHTTARDGRVVTRLDGRMVKLDAGMNRNVYHGHPAALILAGGTISVVYSDGDGKPESVQAEGLYVGPDDIPDATVADVLANGSVTLGSPRGPGTIEALVERDGTRVPAVFVTANDDDIQREVAAYRLDRLLQLGLVPATAARDLQGRHGYLQARPERWASQAEAIRQSLRPGGWCPIDAQLELVYVFDSLTDNEGRTDDNLLYDVSEWRVLVTGHADAFSTDVTMPDYLKDRPAQPGAELARRLKSLDAATLKQSLGNLLDDAALIALLARRDVLVGSKAADRMRPYQDPKVFNSANIIQ